MHRRDLLKYLLGTPLAAVVDYEKLLWIPGEKKIFIPEESTEVYRIVLTAEDLVDNINISFRGFRIPLEIRPGGLFKFYENGDMPWVHAPSPTEQEATALLDLMIRKQMIPYHHTTQSMDKWLGFERVGDAGKHKLD